MLVKEIKDGNTVYLDIAKLDSCSATFCCQVTSVVSDSVRPHRWKPTRLFYPWDSPSKNTGWSCPFLLQGIFLTQGSNPFPAAPALSGEYFTTEPPGKWLNMAKIYSSLTKSTVGPGSLPGSSSPSQCSQLFDLVAPLS